MSNIPQASVVICSYEDGAIIEKSLAAFTRQSFQDFEIVIADDGSQTDYEPVLKKWAAHIKHGLQHVTHEKKGFRRARILNRGIYASRADRIVFLDMDCLPHRDFVRNHLRYLRAGIAITGRRVHIQPEEVPDAEFILKNGLRFGIFKLFGMWMRKKARVIEHGFVSPILFESSYSAILGSNVSFCKADLLAVNGFNEEFIGWGGEETDLELRMRRNGLHVRNMRNKVIQYHLAHPQRTMENKANSDLLAKTRNEPIVRANIGLAEIEESDFTLRRYSG